mmetsp:Transcript_5292/g.21005  ORF Transcript_5292/g.21005 Transcript_5292/m.21005 type:complete len:109 (+) Transcript_5292:2288-2614(+)
MALFCAQDGAPCCSVTQLSKAEDWSRRRRALASQSSGSRTNWITWGLRRREDGEAQMRDLRLDLDRSLYQSRSQAAQRGESQARSKERMGRKDERRGRANRPSNAFLV